LDVNQLWQRIEALPPDWKTASALDGFAQSLDRLSHLKLLQNVVDTMVDAHQRTTGSERHDLQGQRRSPRPVLCAGVQAAELARRYAGRCIGDPACVFRDNDRKLRLLVHPELRTIVQAEDLAYPESLLSDFLERARQHPEELFNQLCSLGVGPLVTQEVGASVSDFPNLLELSLRFVELQ
jgi:hypothetical protein